MSSPLDITLRPPTEHQIQAQCVRWFSLQYPALHQLLFAIPNGGHRTKAAAGKAKAEGAKAGVADLFLSVPKAANLIGFAHGLYIEMKTPEGRQTPEQKNFQRTVQALGYHYTICRSLEEFQQTIRQYLGHPTETPQA